MSNTNVQELEIAVKNLSPSELETFTKWMANFIPSKVNSTAWVFDMFHGMWDKQIERDLDEGKFDKLFDELEEEYKQGLTRPL